MIVIVLFLLLFWLILHTKLRIQLSSEGTKINIILKVWRIPVFRMRLILILHQKIIPYLYWERKKVCLRMFPNSRKSKKKRPEWVKWVFRESYKTEKLHIHAVIGTESAAQTACIAGMIRILLENILNGSKTRCEDKEIRIAPDFSREILQIKLDCIITASVADIIRNAIFSERRKKYASNRKHIEKHNV